MEQVVDHEQTNLLGALLRTMEESCFNGKKPLTQCVEELYQELLKKGFGAASGSSIPGNLAMIRRQELWAMVNRYRALKLKNII